MDEREEKKVIKYSGMSAEESGNNVKQLPAGAYVAQILDAKVEGNEPDQRLVVYLEIYEGPFKGWYMQKYNAQKERGSNYEVRYKGILRIRIPNPDNKNAMYPESDQRRFNDMIAKLQNSNPNTVFFTENGFDETLMKGKLIGISVADDEYNGNRFTKPVRFENVDDVRNGTVNPIRPREPEPAPAPVMDQTSGMQVVTEKLPWDDRPY